MSHIRKFNEELKNNRLSFISPGNQGHPKPNKALKECPNIVEYLQDVLDLGYTNVTVDCSVSRSTVQYLSLSIDISYGDEDESFTEEDFENLAELMRVSLELKDRVVGDGWEFSSYSIDDQQFDCNRKSLTLWFGKNKKII